MGRNMDFGRAFTFVSEDKDWIIKIVIGAVLPFVPFLILPVLGYQVAIVRNVIHDEDTKFKLEQINESYPRFLRDQQDKFMHLIGNPATS